MVEKLDKVRSCSGSGTLSVGGPRFSVHLGRRKVETGQVPFASDLRCVRFWCQFNRDVSPLVSVTENGCRYIPPSCQDRSWL